MKIDIKKINRTGRKFSINFIDSFDSVVFCGCITRISSSLFKMEAEIKGSVTLVCDLSGEEFLETLNERVYILFKDGLWKSNEVNGREYESYDVIEIFDSHIDLNYILYSELESVRLDYHVKM